MGKTTVVRRWSYESAALGMTSVLDFVEFGNEFAKSRREMLNISQHDIFTEREL